MENVRFKGVKIDNVSFGDVYRNIEENIEKRGYICLTDVRNVICALEDREMFHATNNSLLSLADGMALAWYARLSGYKGIERIPGAKLMARLMEGPDRYRHFLLGDTEETINRIIERAEKANPKVHVTGYSPPFKAEFDYDDNERIFQRIERANPDIIWVSLGGVKQDKWMYNNFQHVDRGIMIGVGAAFRYYIGELKVPPKIVQTLALQWLFRMIQVPEFRRSGVVTVRLKFLSHLPWEVIKSRCSRFRVHENESFLTTQVANPVSQETEETDAAADQRESA